MNVRFGEFTLDVGRRQLTREGQELHLSPKAFQLLSLLVQARPAVVDRTTIRQHLWPDTHVVDAALNNLVAEVRSTLGSEGPTILRTVHGVGYAFTAEVADGDGSRNERTGAPRCWLVWNHRTIVLEEEDSTIGRDPRCAVWIDAPGVSRRHARILATDDGDPVIEDLGSTNGTYLRGKRFRDAVPLVDGDTITLGDAELTFRMWPGGDAPTRRVNVKPRR